MLESVYGSPSTTAMSCSMTLPRTLTGTTRNKRQTGSKTLTARASIAFLIDARLSLDPAIGIITTIKIQLGDYLKLIGLLSAPTQAAAPVRARESSSTIAL